MNDCEKMRSVTNREDLRTLKSAYLRQVYLTTFRRIKTLYKTNKYTVRAKRRYGNFYLCRMRKDGYLGGCGKSSQKPLSLLSFQRAFGRSARGTRAAECGGIMEIVGVWVRKSGEWAIIHSL